jgi:murein DD-endopeptidase MepM/ murein hydrolase activator NlpD
LVDPWGLTTWPVEQWWRVTEPFGERIHPTKKKRELHSAVDFGQRGTSGKVYAVESGIVIAVGQTSSGTSYLKIKDKSGLIHGYFHTTANLKVGACVTEGQVIGKTDVSGHATGPHLHYTIQTGPGRDSRFAPLDHLSGATVPGRN